MPDLLVRNLDPEVYEQLKCAAQAEGKSLAQMAREVLTDRFRKRRDAAWAEADRIRAKIGKVSEDSTDIIRAWRDNAEPHR